MTRHFHLVKLHERCTLILQVKSQVLLITNTVCLDLEQGKQAGLNGLPCLQTMSDAK